MNRMWRCALSVGAGLLSVVLVCTVMGSVASADVPPDWCATEPGVGDEVHTVCVPQKWHGGLILWAHGTVFPSEPITISHLYIPGTEISIPEVAARLGYAFAASSYSKNGYAVESGIGDSYALYEHFVSVYGQPTYTYVLGASEGGLVAVKLLEDYPSAFDGGLALCGPLGGYSRIVPHGGDFRVVFDYFFPDVLPGSAMSVPADGWQYWETPGPGTRRGYYYDIVDAVRGHPRRRDQLLNVTKTCTDQGDPDTAVAASTLLLSYSIFATNDMLETIGGIPYDNRSVWYRGSACDWCLNRGVDRFQADPAAVSELLRFAPTGDIEAPLVTLHTTCDPLVPFRHEIMYWRLARAQGDADKLLVLPTQRYGHCAFEIRELLLGFAALVYRTQGRLPALSRFEEVDVSQLPEWVTSFESEIDFSAGEQ